MNLQTITCLIICGIPSLLSGQGITDDVEQEIQRRISLEINPSISIGLLLPSGEAEFYDYGQYDGQTNQKADSLTLYEIGSVTKTFTATFVDNYLKDSLDSSVSQLFPESNNADLEQITLFELQNHIAGVPRLSDQFSPEDWSDPFRGYSDSLLNVELQHLRPDTSNVWSYSNFGYGILGKALEKATKRAFEDLISELLLEARMPNTLLKHQSDVTQKLAQPSNIGKENYSVSHQLSDIMVKVLPDDWEVMDIKG